MLLLQYVIINVCLCSDLTEATLTGGSLSISAALFIAFLLVAVRHIILPFSGSEQLSLYGGTRNVCFCRNLEHT